MNPRDHLTAVRKRLTPYGLLNVVNERGSALIRRYRGTRVGTAALLMPAALIVTVLLVVPAVILIRYSFFPFVDGSIQSGWTLANYERIGSISLYQRVTVRTIRISVVVTLLCVLIGFPLAYAAVRTGGWLGRIIVLSTFAPLTIDLVIRSFGWFVLLDDNGPVREGLASTLWILGGEPPSLINNEIGIIIGLTHVMLPFMVFPIISVLHTVPATLEEAARDLGANRLQTIRLVVLPLSLPGVVAGMLMVFLLTMAAYVTPAILGGTVEVLPTLLTDMITTSRNWPFAGALSMILLVVAVVVIAGYHRVRGYVSPEVRVDE